MGYSRGPGAFMLKGAAVRDDDWHDSEWGQPFAGWGGCGGGGAQLVEVHACLRDMLQISWMA